MEPRREVEKEAPQSGVEPKVTRFRIVKLEERIAPNTGANGTNHTCNGWKPTVTCGHTCWCGY